MVKVEAVVIRERIETVIDAVEEATGHVGVTVVEAVGHGRQRGITHEYRGRVFESRFLPKAVLTFLVPDAIADAVAPPPRCGASRAPCDDPLRCARRSSSSSRSGARPARLRAARSSRTGRSSRWGSGPLAIPLHLGAADDVVGAVLGPADPGLVAAVVVVAPEHERGRLVPHRHLLGALVVEPAPEPHELVGLELVGDRRRVGVTGMDDGVGGSVSSTSMTEFLRSA